MIDLKNKIQVLENSCVKTCFANYSVASQVNNIECANGLTVHVGNPKQCLSCNHEIDVYSAKATVFHVNKRCSILDQISHCKLCGNYNRQIYVLIHYFLGTKVYLKSASGDLSSPVFDFPISIVKATSYRLNKIVSKVFSFFSNKIKVS